MNAFCDPGCCNSGLLGFIWPIVNSLDKSKILFMICRISDYIIIIDNVLYGI